MFNLNRETKDTTALNSWNRRNYITSDPTDPALGIVIPPTHNQWRRNLILGPSSRKPASRSVTASTLNAIGEP